MFPLENRPKRDVIVTLVQRGYDSDPVKAWKDSQKDSAMVADDGDDTSSVVSSTASGAGGPDFNYLLNMALLSLSKEKKEELLKEKESKVRSLVPQPFILKNLYSKFKFKVDSFKTFPYCTSHYWS